MLSRKELCTILGLSIRTLERSLKEIGNEESYRLESVGKAVKYDYAIVDALCAYRANKGDLCTPRWDLLGLNPDEIGKDAIKEPEIIEPENDDSEEEDDILEMFHVEHGILNAKSFDLVCLLFREYGYTLSEACEKAGISRADFFAAIKKKPTYLKKWNEAYTQWQIAYGAEMEAVIFSSLMRSIKNTKKEKKEIIYKHEQTGVDEKGEPVYSAILVQTKHTIEDNILDIQALKMAKEIVDSIKIGNKIDLEQFDTEMKELSIPEIDKMIKELKEGGADGDI